MLPSGRRTASLLSPTSCSPRLFGCVRTTPPRRGWAEEMVEERARRGTSWPCGASAHRWLVLLCLWIFHVCEASVTAVWLGYRECFSCFFFWCVHDVPAALAACKGTDFIYISQDMFEDKTTHHHHHYHHNQQYQISPTRTAFPI